MIHKDPFDRVLITQTQIELMSLVTKDKTIQQYPVEVIK